jgi:hypothetical protein
MKPPNPESVRDLLAKMADEREEENDVENFCKEARRFFCGNATRLTEEQLAAVTIVNTMAIAFTRGTSGAPELPPEIRRCADSLINKTLAKRRIDAIRAIESTVREMQFHAGCLVTGSDDLDKSSAKKLVQMLDASSFMPEDLEHDRDFTVLYDDLPDLILKLKSCSIDAKGKRGVKSPARVLAELIFDANRGFGFKVDGNETDEHAVERIRKMLDAEMRGQTPKGPRKQARSKLRKQHKRR